VTIRNANPNATPDDAREETETKKEEGGNPVVLPTRSTPRVLFQDVGPTTSSSSTDAPVVVGNANA